MQVRQITIIRLLLASVIIGSLIAIPTSFINQEADAAAGALHLKAYNMDKSKQLSMWVVITDQYGNTVKTGFTPLSFSGTLGVTYTVTVSDYGSLVFDHWGNGSTNKSRSFTVSNSNLWFDAYYRTSSSPAPTPTPITTTPTTDIQTLIPKTGIFTALYMYPGSTLNTYWQQVIDAKLAHPSVPIVAVVNPSSGPGSWQDSNFVNGINKLKNAGVIVLGYTYSDYGTRSLSAIQGDVDKYKNWYNADGIFIDEFTNKVGYENYYKDITTYAKSKGMKMTMGNPGTDVPQSYIGTVDVINITEGRGYMPISWLQYCVLCDASSGWHYKYDKRNFSYIRYDISWLDTAFEVDSSQWVGLLYIHSGNDSNGRWFNLPSYFATEVATLDR